MKSFPPGYHKRPERIITAVQILIIIVLLAFIVGLLTGVSLASPRYPICF